MGLIDDNLKKIDARIKNACQQFNRQEDEITVVAISKTASAEVIKKCWQAGLTHFGENRVQEAAAKIPLTDGLLKSERRPTWHMVGHLQTNKAKQAVKLFDIIESVDSLRLAKALSDACSKAGIAKRILLEVNSSGETSKYGLSPEGVMATAKKIDEFDNLQLTGLMTIGPFTDNVELIDKAFALTQTLFKKIQDSLGEKINTLSMGMSADLERAIKHGTSQLRIGTAIFGPRKY